ncbi:PEGA domain-containing protein [Methanogenium organophilum]|uniref:PEGA domain-containing protein n=1 Tax=Methanogenium organophilum TaxID=2199 RepID=A0A9X9T8J5_METOG|nr:PEGA domain-containing protein [Methanogenium organophilum]WAI02543.1 PEGA domain-containing protein [Methanogenium organophilum]
MQVSSSPSGAAVYVNSVYYGTTPHTVSNLPAGNNDLRLTYSGYKDYQDTINIVAGQTQTTYASLTAEVTYGTLSVSSTPSGAAVYVNSVYYGTTPQTVSNLPAGNNNLRLTYSGYKDYQDTINIVAGQTQTTYASLTAEVTYGTLSVSSTPSNANIYLDGAYKGTAPRTISGISEGVHTLEITMPGYQEWANTIQIHANQVSYVTATLTADPQATTGSISISSNPSYASVYVDSIYYGTTNPGCALLANNIAAGNHVVTLTKAGYVNYTTPVSVTAGTTSTVDASLAASGGVPGIEWQKCLGGSSDDYAYSTVQTTDGGYAVAGYTLSADGDVSGKHNGYDSWVVKLSSTGTIVWQKCLGGSNDDRARSIVQTADGGYAVAGYTYSDDSDVSGNHGGYDYWVVKLSSTGTIVWQKCLSGSSWDYARSIVQTVDGGYAVAGYTTSTDGDVSGNHGSGDYWVVKLEGSGSVAAPVAAFTAGVTSGTAPLTVQFTDRSSGGPTEWHWSFGDGATSDEQNPVHVYTADGTYTVTLAVNGGEDTFTRPDFIIVTSPLLGDANNDGEVNQADTLRVLKEVVGFTPKPSPGTDQFTKTDVHTNSVIDVGDAMFIAQYNVGLRDAWFALRI